MIGDGARKDGAELGVLVLAALAARARGVVDHALGERGERGVRIARDIDHGVRDAELAIRRREESCEPRRARLGAIPRYAIAERADAGLGRRDILACRRMSSAEMLLGAAFRERAVEVPPAIIRGEAT